MKYLRNLINLFGGCRTCWYYSYLIAKRGTIDPYTKEIKDRKYKRYCDKHDIELKNCKVCEDYR